MKKFIISIISLVLFFSNVLLIDEVKADETKVKNYKFERDITIDGVIGSNSTFFEVNKNWDIEEVLLHLNFSKSQILNGDVSSLTVSINEYPYPYAEIENNLKLDTTMVVPDNMTRGESTAVFNLASEFGKITKNDSLKLDVKLYSEMKNWSDDNIIYIGKPENTAEEILDILSTKEQTLLSSNCLIKQVDSPYNNKKKMMLVIGSNEEDLIKASNLLIEKRLSNQVLSSSILVNKDTNIKINGEQELNLGHLTLKDLGYSDFLLEGEFNQQALFDIKIPKGKVLDNGSKIVLNLRYSDNLDFEKSLVTVKENESLSFESYPYPFVRDDEFNDLTVIMPDYSGSQAMTWMSRLGANLGANINSHNGKINVIRGKEFNDKYEDTNIIVFGVPHNSSVIKKLNNNLNIKFNKNYSNFLPNDKISFIDDYGKNISAIQLIKSPYNNQKNIMVISSINEKNLYLGMDYLLNKSKANDLKGDTLTIDEYGEVEDLAYNVRAKKEVKDSNWNISINKTTKVFLMISFITIIVAIILSMLYIKKYKRR
ncbi:cellulose biosynthesis cyclic di-GMP-binding regulatory protein BcsB [Clostridioides sp. ES-S-0171-01]|nr:cellulose biosynthesis cyclic di-GMP-binding regulatory protein BcsB [Clostridioides sp. ES-S-0171-01]MCC0689959.1 cellulose biosynthesis cyclic di-GMP-binding regulatory protein BcsB [Clostridioides sp. ES-S-0056-01]MCC0716965.1 cellulose biosynthesis cyclic di-GMP-binding regulatory protein BcsB [Clostridioides sp. ES-S-0077-01]UDN55530.1 cellulose biosynthesis cyclic di-GMP-binding regulatory protein BcsB [Clostridioides sp. ES-S-0054-01]